MTKLLFCLLFCAATLMAVDKTVYDFTLNTIDGQPAPLAAYKGKVVLLVNVASRCEQLWRPRAGHKCGDQNVLQFEI
jgi:hypothetical protein